MVSAPVPVPVTASSPLLPFCCAEVTPNWAPKSRSKVSLTTTMRASMSTCRTGTSSVCTRRRISARFSAVSCTISVLVRSSIDRLPRLDSMELRPPPARAAGRGTDHFRKVRHLGVVGLHELRADGRELLDFLVRRQLRLFARRELLGRSDDDDVILAALVESLGAQHDVEGLIPGDVLQTQRQIAGHRIAHHDVLAAGVGKQLQHRAHVDVLEVRASAARRCIPSSPRRRCASSEGLISTVYWLSDW